MKKRILTWILALCFVVSLMPHILPEAYASGQCGENLTWRLDTSTGVLTISGTGKMDVCYEFAGSLHDSYLVYKFWHNRRSAIKTVIVEEGVTALGAGAFELCHNITSVSLPSTLETIDYFAFSGCKSLTSVTIPESVTSIGIEAFCQSGLTEVTIPDSVTSLEKKAFRNCQDLTQVKLSDSITAIADETFEECNKLTSVTIPEGVLSIGKNAFYKCTKLASVTIPGSVTTIGEDAFMHCSSLTSVTIPEGVTTIGDAAFWYCTGLKSVELPDSLTSIGLSGFAYCSSLTFLTIPVGLSKIEYRTFYHCTALTSLVLPENITEVKQEAFSGCTEMQNIYILNPDCEFSGGDIIGGNTRATIYGHPSSPAETYAKKYRFSFLRLCHCEDYACDYQIETVQEPTCQPGIYRYTCSQCGYTYEDSVAPTDHDYALTASVAPGCETAGTNTYTCTVCGTTKTETVPATGHSFVEGACVCGATCSILDESIRIRHTLDLAGDISINYVIDAASLEAYDTVSLQCNVPLGEEIVPVHITEGERKGDYYYFTLTGVTAVQMGDKIEATLSMTRDGKEYISATDIYCVADYAYSQMNKQKASDALKTLCADLLRYGAAAQTFKGYRTDALADGNMTPEQKAYLSDLSGLQFGDNDLVLDDLASPAITWAGKGLNLDSKITLRFVFDASAYEGSVEDLTLKLTYVNRKGEKVEREISDPTVYQAEKNYYAFDFDGLLAAELRTVVTAAVYAGDAQVSASTCYSADSYGNGRTGTLAALCEAMVAYSDSALAYFN